MRLRLPEERPKEPPTGYKIARPVLSHDGTRAGFTGVSLGVGLPYGVLDEARCVYGRRHKAPHRRCDCGFHCVRDRSTAEALLCTAEHRGAVLLDVRVLGAYIRFEQGFRYARQRVCRATVPPCGCGAAAPLLADAGWGRPGWRVAEGVCGRCAGERHTVSVAEFERLAGEGLRMAAAPAPAGVGPSRGPGMPPGLGVPELVAEAALLQARLDWFQSELARFTGEQRG
ncbi:hypothetical protein DCW30_33650 [Streptomyces alfalfae]|uniref:Uncharacterized protein n=1 Tax=Streptomyces alfalfae TaxID=1642299 RepID=A0A1P8TMT0_9ACTN|nr:hypothetical protein [Streptomyces alfalfae]AYA19343.1 hypothetical protein D3X13_26585 [Streptomyces fradiae]APY88923.1 hypothetical protein A7J05_27405 [Streptomyces alfalfae]QQC88673.1 hypothetical protein I8755_09820 [Streptomyces alfalfae]QUI31130.1 hypothetical protein H9W91_09885 [Streptomyces alfalfae]RXX36170.1 hypothetical protein DCW30_33650 [Streptomyces alfalfae]